MLSDHPQKPGWVSSSTQVCWNIGIAAYLLLSQALSSPTTVTPPSATQLLARTDVQQAFRQAYLDSSLPGGGTQEQGGWIYANRFNADDIVIIRAGASYLSDASNGDNPNLNIHLGNNPTLPSNSDYRMVADFHTHPDYTAGGNVVHDPAPSQADIGNIWAGQTPGFVIAGDTTWVVGPESRAHMDGPRGYAVTVGPLTEGNVDQSDPFREHPEWSVNGGNSG